MAGSTNDITAPPKDEIERITKGIQNAVQQHFQEAGDADTLTVNNIRTRAEANLKLTSDFLRTDPYWRNVSKVIIREEFERQNNAIDEGDTSHPPKKATPLPKEATPKKKGRAAAVKQPEKNSDPSDEDEAPRKAQQRRIGKGKAKKVITSDEDEEHSELSEEPSTAKKRPRTQAKALKEKNRPLAHPKVPDPGVSDVEMGNMSSENMKTEKEQTEESLGAQSESEMSEVLDITPKKKRQRTSATSKSKSTSKASTTKGSSKGRTKKSKESTPLDADTEKIKELQGWLSKCGVRKLWGKELAKFTTPKEKIAHLKGMLADIGMTGRYSNDKAKKIKEERELAADLEAVQEGARVWGADNGETMKTRSSRGAEPPTKTRKLVRPPELAFLDGQSEESD